MTTPPMMTTPQYAVEPDIQEPPVTDWLEALGHGGPFERLPTAMAWNRAGLPLIGAVRRLIPCLKDADAEVRKHAVRALGNLGGQAHWILGALRAALRTTALTDDDDDVRNLARRAVLTAGPRPDTEVAALVDSLHDSLGVVRFHAAIALGDLGRTARAALPALIHASLWDEDPAVRIEAAIALWKIDRKTAPRVIPTLIEALDNANELLCWIAADFLGEIGSEAREAVPALQKALQRRFKIQLVRRGIMLALERIGQRAGVGRRR
jgi:HEAT repeat protein